MPTARSRPGSPSSPAATSRALRRWVSSRAPGKVAVATVTRDGFLFLTDTNGKASANDQWWHFHHDERNTGLYGADTRPPATVDDLVRADRRERRQRDGQMDRGRRRLVGRAGPQRERRPALVDLPDHRRQLHLGDPVPPPATTAASGSPEQVTVTGLPTSGQTIYFAERATDDAGNTSLIAPHPELGYPRPGGDAPERVARARVQQVHSAEQLTRSAARLSLVHAPPTRVRAPDHLDHRQGLGPCPDRCLLHQWRDSAVLRGRQPGRPQALRHRKRRQERERRL